MSKKQFGDYYVGLDIGTDSVGWAVTDTRYEVLRFNGKAMWGSHLFKEGQTAEERRAHRIARRRLERRKNRIKLLRELLSPGILSIDPTFFDRMDESNLVLEDRKLQQKNSLFNEPGFTDKEYHKRFPTIYHLRSELLSTDKKPDLRLVYLALAHILKNRGHFLYEGLSDKQVPEFSSIFNRLQDGLEDLQLIDCRIVEEIPKVEKVLLSRSGVTAKKEGLIPVLNSLSESDETKDSVTELIKALAGGKFSIGKMFGETVEKALEEHAEFKSIALNETKIDDEHDELESLIGSERIDVLDTLRSIYNWSVLTKILQDSEYISQAKIKEYNQHKHDLALLKVILKNLDGGKMFDEALRSTKDGTYTTYSRQDKDSKESVKQRATQEDFCKYLKSLFKDRWDEIKTMECVYGRASEVDDMRTRIEDDSFMPLQRSKDNSVLPNAVHLAECKKILENVSRFYPFLTEKDSDGYSITEKVQMLCSFRMPYYVGPVSKESKTGWIKRNSDEPVRPWNYNEVIDVEATSKGFIEKLIGYCTYLLGERVLPKQSIAYCRFKLYNELNNIKINGVRISPEMRDALIAEYFENKVCRVTTETIKSFCKKYTGESTVQIEGMDIFIKSNLESEIKLKSILGDRYDIELAEDLIRTVTIFGDDRKRLRRQIESEYSDRLAPEMISKLTNLRFKDWGNLSEKFLRDIRAEVDGREMSILAAMKSTNKNLMELLSKDYGYLKQIDEFNKDLLGLDNVERVLERMRCSPSVKHSILRCDAIMNDIVKITGHPPAKIFIETTREHRDSGRTTSRKQDLLNSYHNLVNNPDAKELLSSLESADDARLRGKKLFAYYSQLGRCMYCGRKIDLNDLGNNQQCDMDHIYPQSKVTDDSLRNNMVLSCRTCNGDKGNRYPIAPKIRSNMGEFWTYLRDNKLISVEKYDRLTRPTEFSEKDLEGFINRQLVETSQTVKAVAEISKLRFGDKSDVVYVKGGNVSQFRQDQSEDKQYYLKCRNINDYHHAKDAYLNIVVGNVYDVKFTKDVLHFIRSQEEYNLNKMFSRDVSRNGVFAWRAGPEGDISTVDKWMRRDNILYTRAPYKATGNLYDLNILKAGNGQLPVKKGMDIEKYGGYNKIQGSYFALFEHDDKKKRSRTLLFIPRYFGDEPSSEQLEKYASEHGLANPSLRMKCIKVDSRLEIDGFRLNIRGTSGGGSGVLYLCGEQLSVPFDLLKVFKNVFKYTDKESNAQWKYSAQELHLTEEGTMCAYEFLISKLGNSPYSKLSPLRTAQDSLNKSKEKFMSLDLNGKTEVLSQILKMFHCNAENANLKEIGGPGVAGRLILSSKISLFDSVILIHQSPTGLFENRIDLLKI